MVPSPRRLPHTISRSHFSARATLSLFATSRFEWDLCATYRSEPILLPIPPECARRVVVVTVLRGPHRGLPGYAITGFFELDEAALVECALTSCPVLKGLPTFGAPHRRAAHDPKLTFMAPPINGANRAGLHYAPMCRPNCSQTPQPRSPPTSLSQGWSAPSARG